VVRDGAVVFGPVVVRTGAPGMETPVGVYDVNVRNPREWSYPYQVWLPYWQNFNEGVGFHETITYLHNPAIGSHGCVNLLHVDAVALWDTTPIGTTVRLFGGRPGT
jgi:lipoprotein-anchoring transpeptidase ErfK/SrfK